jgi:hypothetical protein
MQTDSLGNPITGGDEAALTAVRNFVDGMLSYESIAGGILRAADRAPDHCLANAYAGVLWMLLETMDSPARAGVCVERAKAAAPGATPREQLTVRVLEAWVRDDVPAALALCDEGIAAWPRDLILLKINQYLTFNIGALPEMLRASEAVLEANQDSPFIHGMIAFGYEECHLMEEAEAAARRALAMRRKEPWAQHALAHVMLTQGRIDEGAEFLEGVQDTWEGLNSFMSTHLWWHLGLFYLSQGHEAGALETYDRGIWGVSKDYSQDQVGAVSMLARIELAGVDVGDRWGDLGEWLEKRGPDVLQPFLTVQYLYGLERSGRRAAAQALLAAAGERARTAPAYAARAWGAAATLAEGLVAHARGAFDSAAAKLTAAAPELLGIGGSHAQRDLFEQVRLDAVMRRGDWSRAQQLLELRRRNDADGVPVNRMLARAYGALGLPREAAKAQARAERTLARTLAREGARRRMDA